jgi:hypothetical protein
MVLHSAPISNTLRGTNPVVDTTRYVGVTLYKRLTWSPQIDQVRKKSAQRINMLGPLLNAKSDLSVRNGVLLYKQFILPMMDYACPAWRSAARTHVRRLQVLHSKCLRLATGATWYVSNRQIHEDLCVPLFADLIRTLTASFDSKLTDVGNPLVLQLGRYLRWPRVDPVAWRESQGRRGQQASRGHRPRINESRSALISRALFDYPDWGYPWFSSVVRQMPGYRMQSRGTARTPLPQARRLHVSA